MAASLQAKPAAADEEMGIVDEADEETPLISQASEPSTPGSPRSITEYGGKDVVQFSAPMFFVDEEEGALKIDIIRLGTMKGSVAVQFHTEDGSARAGLQYEHKESQVVFRDGEHTKTISIPILDDGLWSATNEFKLSLGQPQNCQLGLYLYRCRVKILNYEKFPTDKYREEMDKGEDAIMRIDDWGLFREYCKLNYYSAGQKWQTLLVLVGDQIGSLCLFGTLCIGVYMVDTIFARGTGSSRHLLVADRYHTAIIIALWYVVPQVMLYLWDVLKIHLDIKGASRKFLEVALMKTSLSYTTDSRDRVSPSDLNVAMNTSAEQVATGYIAALNTFGILGRIAAIVIFINIYQSEPLATWSVFILVVIVVTFTIGRVGIAHAAQLRLEAKLMLVETLTDESRSKYRLFADYAKRSLVTDMFVQAVGEYNGESIPNSIILLNTQYAMKILSGICITIYIIARTPAVLNNELSLGVFLATISIFSTYLSDCIKDLNDQMIAIVNSFVPLKEFAVFLNLPLDLSALKQVNRARRSRTTTDRNSLLVASVETEAGAVAFKSDLIPILVSDLSFEYTPGVPILKNVNMSITQGQMIAVIGPHASGKTTFCELFANILQPTGGNIFVPSHLRVLHIDREPMFLRSSMWHNLTLGLAKVNDAEQQRVKSILKQLDMGDVIDIIDEELKEHGGLQADWQNDDESACKLDRQITPLDAELKFLEGSATRWEQSMTLSRRIKLHLARALIANPEILVVKRTLQGFNDDVAEQMIDLLRQHISEKGLGLPEEGRSSRRPRNVLFITENVSEAMKADSILQIDPKTNTIVQLTPQELVDQGACRSRSPLSPRVQPRSPRGVPV